MHELWFLNTSNDRLVLRSSGISSHVFGDNKIQIFCSILQSRRFFYVIIASSFCRENRFLEKPCLGGSIISLCLWVCGKNLGESFARGTVIICLTNISLSMEGYTDLSENSATILQIKPYGVYSLSFKVSPKRTHFPLCQL